MQKEPSQQKDCHTQLVVKDFKKSQKPEKVVTLQSNADDVGQKANSHKLYVDWNNESGIITLAPAQFILFPKHLSQHGYSYKMNKYLINKCVKRNNKNNLICAMFYSTVYPELKAIVFNKDKVNPQK